MNMIDQDLLLRTPTIRKGVSYVKEIVKKFCAAQFSGGSADNHGI